MSSLVDRRLGKYRILEEIGRGGMATVYKAWDSSRKGHVALKVLPTYFIHDALFVERFRRESQAAASLHHPHIVQLYEAGEREGTLFMVMQYVDGGTLKELLQREAPLDPEECLPIVEHVAAALDYAHQQGFVHRDVKPTNILLTRDGRAILTDFGIAKAAAGTSLTRTGLGMGTPEYMSPEQSQGKDVDSRSDVYSLGIVLYEMLTGAVPFKAETPLVVLHHHVYEAPTPPRQLKPTMPTRVEQVVLKALAKRPEQRYATAGDLAQALRRAVLEERTAGETVVQVPAMAEAQATVAIRTGADEAVVDPLYSQAIAAFDSQRWTEAIELFTQILAVAGDYRDTFAKLTEASRQRRLSGLLTEAGQALKDEDWTLTIDLCVAILSLERNCEEAETLLRRARRAQELQAFYREAAEELASGSLASAARYLERVVELDPSFGDAARRLAEIRERPERQRVVAELLSRGKLLLDESDWQGAAECLRSVLSLEPDHKEALELLSASEAGLDGARKLESLYREASERLQEADWPEAIGLLERILGSDATYLDAEELLSRARSSYARATALAKKCANAQAAAEGGDRARALSLLEDLLEEDPGHAEARQLAERLRSALAEEEARAPASSDIPAKPALAAPTVAVRRRRLPTASVAVIVVAGLALVFGGFLVASRAAFPGSPAQGDSTPPGGFTLATTAGNSTPSPQYDAEEIMALTSEAMTNVQSFTFQLETSGMTVYLEGDVPATLREAQGKVLRPGSVDMQASVDLGPIPVPIRIIAVGPDTWLGDPTGTAWTKGPWALDLSSFFGQGGLLDGLWGLGNMVLIAAEEVGGKPAYHLTAEIEQDIPQLQQTGIVAGAHVELWTDAATFHVRRLNLTGTGSGSEAISWTINLDGFDQPVVVQPPDGTGIQSTPQPTATPTPAGMQLFDSLDSPAYWRATTDDISDWFYAEGEYHGRLTAELKYSWKSRGDHADFRAMVEVTAQAAEGGAGLVFRLQGGPEAFYLFLIDAKGQYALKSWQSAAGWQDLVAWQPSSFIRTGNAQNRLEVICLGDSTALLVNGQHLTTVSDATSGRGKIGPVVFTFLGDSDAHWSFDNFSIWDAPTSVPTGPVGVGTVEPSPMGTWTTPTPSQSTTTAPTPATPRADTTPPRILSTSPANGETEVRQNLDSVSITFNEPMQDRWGLLIEPRHLGCEEFTHEVGSATFVIKIHYGGERDGLICGDALCANATWTITVNPLGQGTHRFKDLGGNLAPTETLSFTTGKRPGGYVHSIAGKGLKDPHSRSCHATSTRLPDGHVTSPCRSPWVPVWPLWSVVPSRHGISVMALYSAQESARCSS